MSENTDKPLRGFGFTLGIDTDGMTVRSWYVGPDGIRRWTHSDEPVSYCITAAGRALLAERKEGK